MSGTCGKARRNPNKPNLPIVIPAEAGIQKGATATRQPPPSLHNPASIYGAMCSAHALVALPTFVRTRNLTVSDVPKSWVTLASLYVTVLVLP